MKVDDELAQQKKWFLRSSLQLIDHMINEVRARITPPKNKRDAARFKYPFDSDDAVLIRERGEALIALANKVEAHCDVRMTDET